MCVYSLKMVHRTLGFNELLDWNHCLRLKEQCKTSIMEFVINAVNRDAVTQDRV